MSRGLQRERAVRDWLQGKCECGCGQDAPIAKKTNTRLGHLAGFPVRFISGHNRAHVPHKWIVADAGFATPCWLWVRATDGRGYGTIRVNGRAHKAHRYYWVTRHGPVPPGLELDHLCRNRACVNPEHLEPVTRRENCRRGAHGLDLSEEQIATIRAESDRARRGRKQRPGGWLSSVQQKYGVSRSTITKVTR